MASEVKDSVPVVVAAAVTGGGEEEFESVCGRHKEFGAVQELLCMLPIADSCALERGVSQFALEQIQGLFLSEFKLGVTNHATFALAAEVMLPLVADLLATLRALPATDKPVFEDKVVELAVWGDYITVAGIAFPKATSDSEHLVFPIVQSLGRSRLAADIVRFLRCHHQLKAIAAQHPDIHFSVYCDLDSLESGLTKLQSFVSFPPKMHPCQIALCKTDPALYYNSQTDLLCLSPSFAPPLLVDFLLRNGFVRDDDDGDATDPEMPDLAAPETLP